MEERLPDFKQTKAEIQKLFEKKSIQASEELSKEEKDTDLEVDKEEKRTDEIINRIFSQ